MTARRAFYFQGMIATGCVGLIGLMSPRIYTNIVRYSSVKKSIYKKAFVKKCGSYQEKHTKAKYKWLMWPIDIALH